MRDSFELYLENEELDEEDFEKEFHQLTEEMITCLGSQTNEKEIADCLEEIQTYLTYLEKKGQIFEEDMNNSKTLQNGINTYTKKMIEIQ